MNPTIQNNHGAVKSARVIEVIQTQGCEGAGTVDNPNRIVTRFWSLDGKLLAVSDPYLNSHSEDAASVIDL